MNSSITFECAVCGKSFSSNYHLTRHCLSHKDKQFLCEKCGSLHSRVDVLLKHIETHEREIVKVNKTCPTCTRVFKTAYKLKRHLNTHITAPQPSKRTRQTEMELDDIENQPSSSKQVKLENPLIKCKICNLDIESRKYAAHLKSLMHKNLCPMDMIDEEVDLFKSAFHKNIITYTIQNSGDTLSINNFFDQKNNKISSLINKQCEQHISSKFNFELFALFVHPKTEIREIKSFQTKNIIFTKGSNITDALSKLISIINSKIEDFQEKESGWMLHNILHLEINFHKFNPLRGSSYIPLPKDIMWKKACINIRNEDQLCFAWSILAAKHCRPFSNPFRTSSYPNPNSILNLDNLSFPLSIKDIAIFEKLNPSISVNVFGLEYNKKCNKHFVVGPYYHTSERKTTHINLLLIENNDRYHYVYISNISRLVSRQLSKKNHKKFICDGCLQFFGSQHLLNNHSKYNCRHITTITPPPGENILSFKNIQNKIMLPFVVYADFESLLVPISNCSPNPSSSSTVATHLHEPCSFSYYIKSYYDDKLSSSKLERSPSCAQNFLKKLKEDVSNLFTHHMRSKVRLPLTIEEELQFEESQFCHLCTKSFKPPTPPLSSTNIVKVKDYCHFTGKYRGSAHANCIQIVKEKFPLFIPVFFHNFSNYDCHLFIKELQAFPEDEISVIPLNKEKYISCSWKFKNNPDSETLEIRFLDSYRFMPSSISKLVSGLNPENFIELKKIFGNKFSHLLRKGVYPYEYMNSWDRFNETNLPSLEKFFSSLTNSGISETDFEYAKNIFNIFNLKNLGEYSDLYLKTDVLLLTDIFENFRKVCYEIYQLDPCHYFTAPGLSWDAMLKSTQIKLELLTDIDMIHFIQAGIRGGISQCSNRYGKANNKYMPDYDPKSPSKFLIYLDANNLYGWAMSQHIPHSGFRWLNLDEIKKFYSSEFDTNSDVGYILDVDLYYPSTLHDEHNDLPFCPENSIAPGDKSPKLLTSFHTKKRYIIHGITFKQCLANGLVCKGIHRVLTFNQSQWLKTYIDINTEKRQQATSSFEKDFFKLMNNSIYGKTMENIEKRVNVKISNHWDNRGKKQGATSLIAKPNFNSSTIFNENLVAIQLNKTKLFYNKPIYIGFSVLEISKFLMYEFHYSYMRNKFENRSKLLYTDTDSLIYEIKTDDFYEDIKPDISDWFDTSDYPHNNPYLIPLLNKKIIGKMKDENSGKIMREFVGLRSKVYAIDVEGDITLKSKGVNKSIVKQFTFSNYFNVLNNKNSEYRTMNRFRSIKHVLFTQSLTKVALDGSDSKRYIIANNHNTLAWGHHRIDDIPE